MRKDAKQNYVGKDDAPSEDVDNVGVAALQDRPGGRRHDHLNQRR